MGLASVQVTNSMGANGCTYINDTLAHTGKFTAVQFTEASVVGAITGAMENSADFITDGTSFVQGQVLYLPFTSITLVSGKAILYKG